MLECVPQLTLIAGCFCCGHQLSLSPGSGESEATTERVGLKVPPQNAEEAISAFTKLFQEAYARQNGWIAVTAAPDHAPPPPLLSPIAARAQESAA